MARRLFEQHEQTEKHKCYGQRPGQTAVTKYTTNKPIIEYSDLSLSVRIQSAWWLAKEGIAILKYGSLVISTLATHRYYSLTSNSLIISTDFQCLVYSYIDKNAGWDIIDIIGKHFNQLVREHVAA